MAPRRAMCGSGRYKCQRRGREPVGSRGRKGDPNGHGYDHGTDEPVTDYVKSLDRKLAEIKANPASRAFVIADAKDADMAFGVRAPGPRSYLARHGERAARFSPEVWTRQEFGYRNLPEFLDIIREVTHQGLVDIMLMSAHVNEQLSIKEGLFRSSPVTPAARAND